ncbi:MAG: carotenoid oxygenase family protein [Actinobacteria bacterium]|nr:MAG: carotenoid oxygenase family protein [Actinomycetota bacterium]
MQTIARDTGRHQLGFQPLEQEHQIDSLAIEGELPRWLSGSLLRTGPSKWDLGAQRLNHWFDGLAMLHRFSIRDGEVSYGNRFLRGKAFRAAEQTGRLGFQEFASDPCRSLFRRLATLFVTPEITDNGAVNITRLGEQYMAMTESPMPVVFDPQTLQTLNVQAPRPGTLPTAHPHRDPASGALIGYTTKLGARSKYQLFTQAPGRPARILASIGVGEPAYMHSFALTERHAVLVAGPLVVKPIELALRRGGLIESFHWKADRATQIYVLDRHTGERVANLDTDALFCFHHVNAFERDGEIVMDLIGYDDPGVIDRFYWDAIDAESRKGAPPTVRRYRLPLDGRRDVAVEQLSDHAIEMPRINYARCNGSAYRYAYGIGDGPSNGWDSVPIVKLDVDGGGADVWAQDGAYPGEPIFVAAPESPREDSGALLSIVLDAERCSSYLLVLDAETMQERARAHVPHHIPFGVHGEFYDDPPEVEQQ